jgi:O-acetylhomoserine (thiol)-lyase
MTDYRIETRCIQSGYTPGNGEPRILPIVQSTTFKYDSAERMASCSTWKCPATSIPGWAIRRWQRLNARSPTSKGLRRAFDIIRPGRLLLRHFQYLPRRRPCGQSSSIYGGTYNLIGKTLREMGVAVTFVNPNDPDDKLEAAFQPNTKLVFAETLANPTLVVCDIEKMARLPTATRSPYHRHTFPTPINCRRSSLARISWCIRDQVHGRACQQPGRRDRRQRPFDWNNGLFPELSEPDESYHGIVYTRQFGNQAYIAKARTHLMRDLGATASPFNAFLLNLGLETLFLRMERHCRNAEAVARFLASDDRIGWINYPAAGQPLPAAGAKILARRNLRRYSFGIRGGREKAVAFMEALNWRRLSHMWLTRAPVSCIRPARPIAS